MNYLLVWQRLCMWLMSGDDIEERGHVMLGLARLWEQPVRANHTLLPLYLVTINSP
jgi:hypothetical protein